MTSSAIKEGRRVVNKSSPVCVTLRLFGREERVVREQSRNDRYDSPVGIRCGAQQNNPKAVQGPTSCGRRSPLSLSSSGTKWQPLRFAKPCIKLG